jgi:hypothetical protein
MVCNIRKALMSGANSSVPASFYYTCPIEDCSDVTRFFSEDPGKNTAATTVGNCRLTPS